MLHTILAMLMLLVRTVTSSRIYVDVDGTLLHGALDAQFIASGKDMDWYNAQYDDSLAVNYELVQTLKTLKAHGYTLVLWTNRGEAQRPMTQANLGDAWHLFDEHQFHAGKKLNTNLDGFTIDNEAKYVPSNRGLHIQW